MTLLNITQQKPPVSDDRQEKIINTIVVHTIRLSSLLVDIVLFSFHFWDFPQGFKTRLLGRCFHTLLIRNVSISPPTDMGSHTYI